MAAHSSPSSTHDPLTPIPILLYGLGAIGSFYAWNLSKHSSISLTVCARSNYTAVSENGLTLHSQIHGDHHVNFHRVIRSPSELAQPTNNSNGNSSKSPFKFIVCTNKAVDLDSVVSDLAPVSNDSEKGEGVTFVIIQNGVGNEIPFRTRFPKASILSCVTWVGATQVEPGVIKHINAEGTQIGLYRNSSIEEQVEKQRLEEFTRLLKESGARDVNVEDNIQTARWEKVVWNAAWNGITALTGLDTKQWLGGTGSESDNLSRRVMEEVISVARAIGVDVGDDVIERHMKKIYELGRVKTSMYWDKFYKRPMELDVILGHVVRKAGEVGVEVRTVEAIWVMLMRVDGENSRERKEEQNGGG